MIKIIYKYSRIIKKIQTKIISFNKIKYKINNIQKNNVFNNLKLLKVIEKYPQYKFYPTNNNKI
jgi:hypothetical protein